MTEPRPRWSAGRIVLAVVLTILAVILSAFAWAAVSLGGLEVRTDSQGTCSSGQGPDGFFLAFGIGSGAFFTMLAWLCLIGAYVPGARRKGAVVLGTLLGVLLIGAVFAVVAYALDPTSLAIYVDPALCSAA